MMKPNRVWIRALLGLTVVTACLAAALAPILSEVGAAPVQAPPNHVVISEFRSTGPNGPADEFIELFNPTGATVNLGGWTLARSTGCTADSTLFYTFSSFNLLPGQHYLLANSQYSGLVSPDATSVNISLDDQGGIALFNGPPVAAALQDQVGMCSLDQYLEGTPLAPLLGNVDQSYDRVSDPASGNTCQDTNNNAADFFLRKPADPQNSSSPLGTCGNPTPSATSTPSPTNTSPAFHPRVIINEIGWAGSYPSTSNQWIELYNTTTSPIDLNGWTLFTGSGSMSITLTGTIPAGAPDGSTGYYLLVKVGSTVATSPPTPPGCLVFFEAAQKYDQLFTQSMLTSGEKLFLHDNNGFPVDSANSQDNAWRAGSFTNYASMERRGIVPDTSSAWITYANVGGNPTVHSCSSSGTRIYGTPKQKNWAFGLVQTPTPRPTKTRTPLPPTPFAHPVINEFLPRAGYDWNQDGAVDVYDEFVEVKNLGPIDWQLSGWKIDVISPGGPSSYTLPAQTLKTGERAVFYGLKSHLALYDSGGTVRLINSRGVIVDARSYGPVSAPDQSHCRLPDGFYWRAPCFPTPGNENSLTGVHPAQPPVLAKQPPPCVMADTVPAPFRQAECQPFGADVYDPAYWDDQAGFKQFLVPDVLTKDRARVQ